MPLWHPVDSRAGTDDSKYKMDKIERLQLEKAEPGKGTVVRITHDFVQNHKDELAKGEIPIYRILGYQGGRIDAERVVLSFLLQQSPFSFENDYYMVPKQHIDRLVAAAEDPFATKTHAYTEMGAEERTRVMGKIRSTLREMRGVEIHPMTKARAIMDSVQEGFSINKASLSLNRNEFTGHEKIIAAETQHVVGEALALLEDGSTAAMLFEVFRSLSNGQTMNHVGRVFGTLIGFMYYYNEQVHKGVAQRIRRIFPEFYRDTYRIILPNLRDHLFTSDNLVPLPLISPPAMKEYALGAFLHDIGKIANLDYFESDAGYNSKEIRQHVFLSSGLILMNYGTEHELARLMAGDHHNALFKQDGYGVTRMERDKGMRKLEEVQRCIGVNSDDYLLGRSLGFLPTEMLAIVDIYDAMTDSSRDYKKPMTPLEALEFLRDRPVAHGRLDPVLFDIFVDFISEREGDIPERMGLAWKIA